MPLMTYYVALPFGLSDDGDLIAGEPKDFQSSDAARRTALAMSEKNVGAIAFSRTGDPATGDFEPALIIARFGQTPDEVE
ncbi:MAG: hypothetical protein JWO28_545 [Hyphomicrobiales bacterium]|jgi:hypothetical protein|nr:hypothetical protein [Hyphomicrobiales bacterium]